MFGEKLRYLRNNKNLYQKDLGEKLGVTGSAISAWENDKRLPDMLMIRDIANFFDVSVDYLTSKNEISSIYENQVETLESKISEIDEKYITVVKKFQENNISPESLYHIIEFHRSSTNRSKKGLNYDF